MSNTPCPPLPGRLNQAEYSNTIDPILYSPNGEREHLHNQLIAAIYGNVTRDLPDPGLAPWVSANDKPSSGLGGKQAGSDANERRVKGEVMLLPSKDRRRIKDIAHNEQFDPYDALASVFTDQQRMRIPRAVDVPPSSASGGINRMSMFCSPLLVLCVLDVFNLSHYSSRLFFLIFPTIFPTYPTNTL